jgi:hypothetical protein
VDLEALVVMLVLLVMLVIAGLQVTPGVQAVVEVVAVHHNGEIVIQVVQDQVMLEVVVLTQVLVA